MKSRSGDIELETLAELAVAAGFDSKSLAARLSVSQRQLQRRFVLHLQCSPRAWLRETRLQRARALLPSSPSVKAVACALGFRQASQFARDFRVRFGVTPSSLRSNGGPPSERAAPEHTALEHTNESGTPHEVSAEGGIA